MRFVLLTASLLLAASATQAQVYLSAGATLGGSASSLPGGPPTPYYFTSKKTSSLLAPQAGLLFSARLGHFALQPGLLYTQKGARSSADTEGIYPYQSQKFHLHIRTRTQVSYLEIPLNIVGTLGANGKGLQVLAGAYVAATLHGTEHYEQYYDEQITPAPRTEGPSFRNYSEDYSYNIGKTNSNSSYLLTPLHRVDWGGNLGLGYARGPWQLQAIYSMSLAKQDALVYTSQSSQPVGYHVYTPYRVWQVRLSYLVGGQRERPLPAFLSFLKVKPAG